MCTNLVGTQVDSTVNNPAECVGNMKANRVRPLAVFDTSRLTWAKGWGDIPTIKEALGVDINYLMLRGIFGPPNMPKPAVDFYQGLLKKVFDSQKFQDYLLENALKPAWVTGSEFTKWLEEAEKTHKDLMTKGGLIGSQK